MMYASRFRLTFTEPSAYGLTHCPGFWTAKDEQTGQEATGITQDDACRTLSDQIRPECYWRRMTGRDIQD